ncbi:putative P-loop containing nucleoside triphosphate hydrolase protein [Seiridium unicorne]|uniref:DNA 3'-5' helicase n=1 Tax=Seiridium unicorne TaxID=138068 RepID=A0ABR2ULD9_9PEZI
MEDDYDSGDDLLANIDPDELASPKKRPVEDDTTDGEDQVRKRPRVNGSASQDSSNAELARSILRQKFGFDDFRHEQAKAIEVLLKGDNALVVFPTGAGKSLCYQIPAIAFEELDKQSDVERRFGSGVTIVVSPLIALMKDQTDVLKAKGIAAECSDSTKTYEENQKIHSDLHSGYLRLLYCSPEKLNNETFVASMKHVPGGVRLIAVDEAHCISEWGAAFRPEYLKVARFASEIKAERVVCLTATATPRVVDDICKAFLVDKSNVFRTSPYRPNLQLLAEATTNKQHKYPKLFQFLRDHPGPTLVYATMQKQVESLAEDLVGQGFQAVAFHAGMKTEAKTDIQERFMASKIRIVVATIAFGMGIDKSNIRNIINWDIPATIEEYSQQIGRAGRDGKPSTCMVYICPDDFYIRENFARGDLPSKKALRSLLEDVFTRETTHEPEGDVIKLGHTELSKTFDIRTSPLAVLFATLELRFGLLRAITPEYTKWTFKDNGTYYPIASRDKSAEGKAIFNYAKKKQTQYHFDPKEAMAGAGVLRSDLMNKINDWHNRGIIEISASGVLNRYRVLDKLPTQDSDLDALTDNLYIDMEAREQDALQRTQRVADLITGKKCFALALAEHFGMGLPDDRTNCGHCTFCLTKRPIVLPPKPTPPIDLEGIKQVLEACDVRDDPRFLARIAFGIRSPRVGQLRLGNHAVFGSLIEQPFDASKPMSNFTVAAFTDSHSPSSKSSNMLASLPSMAQLDLDQESLLPLVASPIPPAPTSEGPPHAVVLALSEAEH